MSIRSSLPASDPASGGSPADAGGHQQRVLAVGRQRAAVVAGAARDPGEHRFRVLAGREPQHPVVRRAWWRRRRRAGLRRSRGRAPDRSARRRRWCRRARWSPAPGRPRAAPAAPVRSRSATRAVRASGSTAIAATGPRQVATTCGSGSAQPVGSAAADGSVPWSGSGAGLGGSWSGTTGGRPAHRRPRPSRRQSRGPSSGNVAQPASSEAERHRRRRAPHPSGHRLHARAARVSTRERGGGRARREPGPTSGTRRKVRSAPVHGRCEARALGSVPGMGDTVVLVPYDEGVAALGAGPRRRARPLRPRRSAARGGGLGAGASCHRSWPRREGRRAGRAPPRAAAGPAADRGRGELGRSAARRTSRCRTAAARTAGPPPSGSSAYSWPSTGSCRGFVAQPGRAALGPALHRRAAPASGCCWSARATSPRTPRAGSRRSR